MGEKLYMELYGNLGKKADSLDHLRETMHTIPKYIPITRMLPTSRLSRFHVLRVRLEVNTCKNLEQRLEEEDHGFKRNANGNLIPIITDKPPAPTYVLQDMKCSCKNRIEQACYVPDVVALKLGYHVPYCATVMGIVKTKVLRQNICPSCYS